MGTTEQYVATRGAALAALTGEARQADPGANGWTVLVMEGVQDLDGFDDALRSIAVEEREPVLGTHVEDSDFGFATAWVPDGSGARLLFNADAAPDYKNGEWALHAVMVGVPADWESHQADRFAEWSRVAPMSISQERALELLTPHWDFAEEPVGRLCDELGLPLPDPADVEGLSGASSLFDRPMRIGSRKVNWKFTRYVVGVGRNVAFAGIWDRKHRGPPITRFAIGELEMAIREAWLMERIDRRRRLRRLLPS